MLRMLLRALPVTLAAFWIAVGGVAADGGRYVFHGDTPKQQTQPTAALEASVLPRGVVPQQIVINIASGGPSEATQGKTRLATGLLDGGSLARGVIQHEHAHRAGSLLSDDCAKRAVVPKDLGARVRCHATLRSSEDTLRPDWSHAEPGVLPAKQHKTLLSQLLDSPAATPAAALTVGAAAGRAGLSVTAGIGSVGPAVATAQQDRVVRIALMPNDTFYGDLAWPALSSNLPAAWEATLGDPAITIAIVDTGVNPVADLAGALVPGYDFVHNGTDTSDDNGHGTEVASIAAARTNNQLGIAGVCGRCTIMPIKVFDANGAGLSSTVAQGIAWAATHGARIINLSAATPTDDPTLDAAIANAITGGAIVVLAAGNAGSANPAAGGYPAASSPNAIRVAGTDPSGALFPWSNHGPWVDIAAPGSAAAMTATGQYFLGLQGTSVAAPFVAGLAGLLLSRDPSLQPATVKTLITANGQPIAGLDVTSGRRIDALASLVAAGYTPPPPGQPTPPPPAQQPTANPTDTLNTSTTRPATTPQPTTTTPAPTTPAPSKSPKPKRSAPKRTTTATKTPASRTGCAPKRHTGTMVHPEPTTTRAKPSCPAR